MAAKRVDAALLTDSNGMLSGIVTAEDIAGRVIAEGLRPEETSLVKVMTRNPVFVMSNSSAIEALQKMVQGKFRHLPVVEHGEVIAMLDITRFLYDAISRMEKAAEQGSAIAAAMEGVERQWGNDFPGPHAFMESLREQMFKPSLSTIITENCSVPVVSPTDPVILAAKKMREHRVNSVIVMTGSMLLGIITSKDLVLRVVAQNLSPEETLVEKAMTANPDCATSDTSILDALHSMQDGKFLHIPVIDKNGQIVACLDALQLTHAAISLVEGASGANDVANTMMQKFWDSALAVHPAEESDALSDESRMVASDNAEGKHIHPPHVNTSFCFKIEDKKGRMHRFSCVSESLDELLSAVAYRLGMDNEKSNINLLYDDDEGDRVLLSTASDLNAAIQHAKSAGWKVLRLHMDTSEARTESTVSLVDPSTAQKRRPSLRFGIVVGAVAVASVGVIVYLKRSQL
ncbi:CBS domain-containing protein CBSCBSPB3-like isoform X3 [Phragmites australis]|nr:CBS domain-containing protein CBSCBSPB3-like isoform X3 [Phragmites australis]